MCVITNFLQCMSVLVIFFTVFDAKAFEYINIEYSEGQKHELTITRTILNYEKQTYTPKYEINKIKYSDVSYKTAEGALASFFSAINSNNKTWIRESLRKPKSLSGGGENNNSNRIVENDKYRYFLLDKLTYKKSVLISVEQVNRLSGEVDFIIPMSVSIKSGEWKVGSGLTPRELGYLAVHAGDNNSIIIQTSKTIIHTRSSLLFGPEIKFIRNGVISVR